MANDYNGYIATYREYQRGDHYRKALTGWGPHSSDYMASRLVAIGRQLNGMPADDLPADQKFEQMMLMPKVAADLAVNDQRATALGEVGGAAIEAYKAALPDDGGEAKAVDGGQPEDIERFDTAFFTWNGGSNFTDDPQVHVQRKVGDEWQQYADQSGEIPVTLQFPKVDGAPAYLSGGQEWHWTAHFEAFVAQPFEIGSERATPAGEYRFTVSGTRRQGRAEVPYQLNSDTFQVKPWDGITVEGLREEDDGRVSFEVGPTHTFDAGGGVQSRIGPVDYPDSYDGGAKFIREQRTAVRDPNAANDGSKVEWYCLTCSFRPWADSGNAETAELVFYSGPDEFETVGAVQDGDRWISERPLADGESAYVAEDCVADAYGNANGVGSNGAVGASSEAAEPGCGDVPPPPDTTAPDTLIASGPADGAETTDTSAAFTYAGDPADDIAGFVCSIDGTAFAACDAAGVSYTGLEPGAHTFAVAAFDASANVDATPATRNWTVTTTGGGDPDPGPGGETPVPGGDGGETPPAGDGGGDQGGPLPAPGPTPAACQRGTRRDDRIDGTEGDDCLAGGRGDDRLKGGAGNDRIAGGPGDDRLIGGPGADTIDCGPGDDVVRADDADKLRGCETVRGQG